MVLAKAEVDQWPSDSMDALKGFLTHFAASKLLQPAVVHTMEYLCIALSPEKHVAAKVSEAVNELTTSSKSNDHADCGVSAMVVGIKQGKTLLKATRDRAQEDEKETAHLQHVSDKITELDASLESIEKSDYDFNKGLEVCKEAFETYSAALTTSTTGASKTLLNNSKKSISDFISTLSRAFIRGTVKDWFEASVSLFNEKQQFAAKPAFTVEKGKVFLQCRSISKDANSLWVMVGDLMVLMTDLDNLMASYKQEKLVASEAVQCYSRMKKIRDNQWKELNAMGLLDETMVSSFGELIKILNQMVRELVVIENSSCTNCIGKIMAKAPC